MEGGEPGLRLPALDGELRASCVSGQQGIESAPGGVLKYDEGWGWGRDGGWGAVIVVWGGGGGGWGVVWGWGGVGGWGGWVEGWLGSGWGGWGGGVGGA